MNKYSSDTKKVAAKLAGMTDACANVHDDERLTELFALAPVDATHIDTEVMGSSYLKHLNGDEYAFIGMGVSGGITCVLTKSSIERLVEIPPRERDLNQLAQDMGSWYEVQDYAELSEFRTVKVNGEWFRFQEWKERRDKRIAAGLIDVNDADKATETLTAFAKDLAGKQTELDPETKAAIAEVVWDLYDTDVSNMPGDPPDWDSAPEGATHYAIGSDVECRWLKSDDDVVFFFDDDISWCEYSSYDVAKKHLKNSISRPPQDSQQEWVNGLPPVGVECRIRFLLPPDGGNPKFERVVIKGYYGGQVWFQDTDNCETVMAVDQCEFRPIQPGQKPDERDKARDEIRGMLSHPTSDDEKVVDLILEWHMSRLTQGGGDER